MAMDTITIHLPDDLHHRLDRLAALTGQPLEGLIVRTLSSNLPPLPDDLAPTTRDALQTLEGMSDDDLRRHVNVMLPATEYARLTELRERRQDGTLTSDEQTELDSIMGSADLLTDEGPESPRLSRGG